MVASIVRKRSQSNSTVSASCVPMNMCGLGMTAASMPIITSFWSWTSSIMSVCR